METIVFKICCNYCTQEIKKETKYYNKLCCDDCKIEIKHFRKTKTKKRYKKPIIAKCLCGKDFRQLVPLSKCLNNHVGKPYEHNSDQRYFAGRIEEIHNKNDSFKFIQDQEVGFFMKPNYTRVSYIVIENDISNLSPDVLEWAKNNCRNYNYFY